MFEQPLQAGQHAFDEVPELPVKEGLQKSSSPQQPLESLGKGKLPLLARRLGRSQRQQALCDQDDDQPPIEEAQNPLRPGALQDSDLKQRFPVFEGQLHLPAQTVDRADGFHRPQAGRDVGDVKRVLEELQIRQAYTSAFSLSRLDRRLLPLPVNLRWQSVDNQPDGDALLTPQEHVEFHRLVALAKTVDVRD